MGGHYDPLRLSLLKGRRPADRLGPSGHKARHQLKRRDLQARSPQTHRIRRTSGDPHPRAGESEAALPSQPPTEVGRTSLLGRQVASWVPPSPDLRLLETRCDLPPRGWQACSAPQMELPKEQRRARPTSQRRGASSAQSLGSGPQTVPITKWLERGAGPLGAGQPSRSALVGGGLHQRRPPPQSITSRAGLMASCSDYLGFHLKRTGGGKWGIRGRLPRRGPRLKEKRAFLLTSGKGVAVSPGPWQSPGPEQPGGGGGPCRVSLDGAGRAAHGHPQTT